MAGDGSVAREQVAAYASEAGVKSAAVGASPPAVAAAGNAALARAFGTGAWPPALRPMLLSRGTNRAVARLAQSRARTLQRRTDMEIEARETMRGIDTRVGEALSKSADDLATFLLSGASDWEEQQVRWRAAERASDDALMAVVRLAGDAANIRTLGATSPTSGVLMTVARRLRVNGHASEAERIVGALVSSAHAHLLGESAVAASSVQSALTSHNATVQSVVSGSGSVVYDEYSIVMDAMPPNLTAEEYLKEMSRDLNVAVGSSDFDDINVFSRTATDKARGAPAVGDVYDIDIKGPDNGSVMLVESKSDHFIFQTITTPFLQTGTHPEYGSREFGFKDLGGGAVRFYTRGVSRPSSEATGIVGAPIQEQGWTSMLKGIGATLAARGGTLRAGSFSRWIRRG